MEQKDRNIGQFCGWFIFRRQRFRLTVSVFGLAMSFLACVPTVDADRFENSSSQVFPDIHRGWAYSIPLEVDVLFAIAEESRWTASEIGAQLDADLYTLSFDEPENDREFTESLDRSDVMVFDEPTWLRLDDVRRIAVLEACIAGLGVVFVNSSESVPGITNHTDFTAKDEPPPFDTDRQRKFFGLDASLSWKMGSIGKGRVVIGFSELISERGGIFPEFRAPYLSAKRQLDYQLSALIRGILWAGRYEPINRIESVELLETPPPDADEIPPQLPSEFMQYMTDAQMKSSLDVFLVTLDKPAASDLSIAVRARRPGDIAIWEADEVALIPEGASHAVLHLPLGRGDFLLDVWATRKSAVVDWASTFVSVERWPMLQDVSFSKYLVQKNDAVEVTYSVRKHLYSPAQSFAHLMITDAMGRVIAHHVDIVPPEGGTQTSRVPWTDAMTRSLRLDVFLSPTSAEWLTSAERRYSSHYSTELVVKLTPEPGLQWIAGHSGVGSPLVHGQLRALYSSGVDAIITSDASDTDTAAIETDLDAIVPYPIVTPQHNATNCINSPEWRQSHFAYASDWGPWAIGNGIRHAVLEWGDLDLKTGPCTCPACVEQLRIRLRSYYPNLLALNQSWNTSFNSWDSVPVFASEDSVAQRVDLGRLGIEQRADTESAVAQYLRDANDDVIPIVTLEDSFTPGMAKRFMSAGIAIGHAGKLSSRRLRSYRSDRQDTGLRSDDIQSAVQLPWLALADGHAFVHTPSSFAEDDTFLRSIRHARDGIDDLLLRADAQEAVLAIYENDTTWFAGTDRDRHRVRRTQNRVVRMLENLGIPYAFMSYEGLMGLGSEIHKAIVVPEVASLSPEEIRMLRSFDRAGGEVLSDVETATLDEHGNAVADPGLPFGSLIDTKDTESLRVSLTSLAEDLAILKSTPPLENPMNKGTCAWSRFRLGSADIYLALQENTENANEPILELTENMRAYDLIEGRYLSGKKARVAVNEWSVSLISILPYRVSRIVVESPDVVAQGQLLPFNVTVKSYDSLPDRHLVRVQIRSQEGVVLSHYDTVLDCPEGQGRGHVSLALNEMPGEYTLLITDLLTGARATHPIEIL